MPDTAWTTLSEVTSQPVRWLWEGRIPLGKVTLLDGEPGVGKSTLALDLAARVSRGEPMPLAKSASLGPADVVIYNADDGLADTVLPRLDAAGADLTRVRAIDREIKGADLAALKVGLIILDPLSAYFCISCEPNPRHVLKNLSLLAKQTGAAILAVQSMPEADEAHWAAEILGAARSVLSLSPILHGSRRLVVTKSNLRPVPDDRPLVYRLQDAHGITRITGWSDHV